MRHMPCVASYNFGTGWSERRSPLLSISRKHQAHCLCMCSSLLLHRDFLACTLLDNTYQLCIWMRFYTYLPGVKVDVGVGPGP